MSFELNQLTDSLREAMHAHAEQEFPRECCGLVLRADGDLFYQRCRNTVEAADGADRFKLHPEDYAAAEDRGEVLAVVHSHPNACANASMADRVGCEASGLPWLIVGWPSGVITQLAPSGWRAPYVGREFHHGVLDCYSLIQDWYWRELRIELPHFERDDDWWTPAPGKPAKDLYMDGFEQAGFVRVSGTPQRHDVVLMQIRSDRANHGAVYVGDGTILHHLHSRLSCHDVYGGTWERHTLALLRHINLVQPAQAFGLALQAA